MVCYEYVKVGWNGEKKLCLHLESAVEYAAKDLLYRYTECLAKYDENSLKAYYINPDEIDEKLRILRENLMNGDGFSGIQSEYYEIHKREVIEE